MTSTGIEASRDDWADRAAIASSTVVTGLSGVVLAQWQGSPYTYTSPSPTKMSFVLAKTVSPAPSGASALPFFLRTPSSGAPDQPAAGMVTTILIPRSGVAPPCVWSHRMNELPTGRLPSAG